MKLEIEYAFNMKSSDVSITTKKKHELKLQREEQALLKHMQKIG